MRFWLGRTRVKYRWAALHSSVDAGDNSSLASATKNCESMQARMSKIAGYEIHKAWLSGQRDL